jgi:putative endopeptidase
MAPREEHALPASLTGRIAALLIAAALLGATSCAVATVEPGAATPPALVDGPRGFSLKTQSRPTRNYPAGDDFYAYVNKDWLESHDLPPDKVSIGATDALMEQADSDVRDMIEELVASRPAAGTIEQKIADLFTSALDEAAIETRGIAPLQPHLARIRAVKTMDDLTRLMGVIGYNSPIGLAVGPSPADPDRNAIWLSQAGLGMPHRGFYLEDSGDMVDMQEGYRSHVATILGLLGHADSESGAKRVFDLEHAIAESHVDEDRSLSAEEMMRSMTFADLESYAPDFRWDLFFEEAGMSGSELFVLMDQTAVADIVEGLDDFPLEDWKLWLEFSIAHDLSAYLPRAFADSNFDFYARQMSGVTEKPARWQFAVGLVNTHLGDAVAQLYVQRHFPEAHKEVVDSIVSNMRSAFESRMRSLDWMDEETRSAALGKLGALTGMIGYPDQWRDFSTYTVEPGRLLENVYASYEYQWRDQQGDLRRPVDRSRWPTHAHVVNAYYNPLANTFVLPAGILKPPFFDPAADPAVNYGGIGAVIGHEMSHGFDDQGRQFDATGRTFNWWTDETDERFVSRSRRLIRQYNNYCPFNDACVNGLGTLGENIGDLAGLEIAYAAYRHSLGGKEAPVIDGQTGDQRFFIAYARTYREKVREEIARAMLDGDSHAPSRYRVNGVVRNMDAWYAAFDVQPGDGLYLAPGQRVRIW